MRFILAAIFICCLFVNLSCGHKQSDQNVLQQNIPQVDAEPPRLQNAQQASAAQLGVSHVITVDFPKGQSVLDLKSIEKLEATIQEVLRKGSIHDVKVVAWADEKYPSYTKKKLDAAQTKIAEERSKQIRTILVKYISDGKIKSFNMARRPLEIEEYFKTSDSIVKNAIESAGLASQSEMTAGKISRSLVMISLEQSN